MNEMTLATAAAEAYQSGFGNEFATEALPGTLPEGRNSPQRPARGLYAEQISGTAFTQPRAETLRTWLYRVRPTATHGRFRRVDRGAWRTAPFDAPASPQRMRWAPFPIPEEKTDLVAGMRTIGGNGDAGAQSGIGIHVYAANADMDGRYFYDADGELLFVPQQGRLALATEMGLVEASPGEIVVVPRGVKFAARLPDGPSRGYVCENYGAALRLPELGPIGSNGLANPRDFLAPTARYEDLPGDFELVAKLGGSLWSAPLDRSPLDVVAWHGTLAPYKYDLSRFNTIGTVSFDHPDPSILTVLTSPSGPPGLANVDFVIFPPRWQVAEDTFRPPWYHRNVMSEFMGLVLGVYDAKPEGFAPGAATLHNCMSGHGPDAESFRKAAEAKLAPTYLGNTMAFMFETRYAVQLSEWAATCPQLEEDYHRCWEGLGSKFPEAAR